MTDPIKRCAEYGRELFALLEEFFLRATGKQAPTFATIETFGDVIRANATELASRAEPAFRWLSTELGDYYARRSVEAFSDAKQIGGMNLVLGGSSRLHRTQLNSISTAVLYSDCVLVPDPVMPWLETDRTEEKFRHVLLLQAVHSLLQLKPLVDADLTYPPLVVFPSWERSLEEHDSQTQHGISRLVTDLLSDSLGEPLAGMEEALAFVRLYPERFSEAVERGRLFVAPGGSVGEPLGAALERYEKEMVKWRSQDWLDEYNAIPSHRRVLLGITERVAPIYHLLENALELSGHPLMCLEQHAHYFRLLSHTSSARLEKLGVIDPRTTSLIDALSSRRLQWLGGIPIDTLARLRLENENVEFRQRLVSAVGRLHESDLEDVGRVAAEVCHEIEAAVAQYNKDLRAIQTKYNRVHAKTGVLAFLAGAALMPALGPLLGAVAPMGVAVKYGHDKIAERGEKRDLARSLVGVLATAKSETEE